MEITHAVSLDPTLVRERHPMFDHGSAENVSRELSFALAHKLAESILFEDEQATLEAVRSGAQIAKLTLKIELVDAEVVEIQEIVSQAQAEEEKLSAEISAAGEAEAVQGKVEATSEVTAEEVETISTLVDIAAADGGFAKEEAAYLKLAVAEAVEGEEEVQS